MRVSASKNKGREWLTKDSWCQALVSACTSTQQRKSTHTDTHTVCTHTVHTTHTTHTYYIHTLYIHTKHTVYVYMYHITHHMHTHSTHTIFTLYIHTWIYTFIYTVCTHTIHIYITLYIYVHYTYIVFWKFRKGFLWACCYNMFTVESSEVLVGGKCAFLS